MDCFLLNMESKLIYKIRCKLHCSCDTRSDGDTVPELNCPRHSRSDYWTENTGPKQHFSYDFWSKCWTGILVWGYMYKVPETQDQNATRGSEAILTV